MKDPIVPPRLVFGDDGAEASDRAWRWIAAHSWPGWRVDVLHAEFDVKKFEWGNPVRPAEWTPAWPRPASDVAASAVRFLAAAADPRAMLADVPANLMVIGIKTSGRLSAVMAGSTAEWLLHHPPSPLAIIRRPDKVDRVLVCADGSRHSARSIEAFASLPLASDCTVTVVSVDDGRTDTSAATRASARLEPHVASVVVEVAGGRPTDAIIEIVDRTTPDLVVLGTRGLTGWRRLRLGSTASSVVRSVASNCLVACEDEA